MSQGNVEVVRAFIDALNQRDWDAALKDVHPDFDFDFSRAVGPVGGVFKLDQMRPFMDEFFGLWETIRFEIDEFVEAGELVATSSLNYHRGRDGIEMRVRPSAVWRIRDGRIVHLCFYQAWPEALEAVGLSEQDAHADS